VRVAQERTRQEFQALLKTGGFDLVDVVGTRSALSIIAATPSPAERRR
jgi:hypothetical protein